jgi:hypothetical protein
MFIELHEEYRGTSFLINTQNIVHVNTFCSSGKCYVATQEEILEVKESYEQVRSLLDVASIE